ncbi:MAG: hypothetical protein IIC79_07370 [Chloroflexi bacterium]|nr:hypothetical protein [Chloroflexota bacterium]
MNNMENLHNKIINLISGNRISSVEVADALNKSGVIDGIRILNSLKYAAGKVEYIYPI